MKTRNLRKETRFLTVHGSDRLFAPTKETGFLRQFCQATQNLRKETRFLTLKRSPVCPHKETGFLRQFCQATGNLC